MSETKPNQEQPKAGSECSVGLGGLDLMFNRDPICPYCGKAYRDAWEIGFNDDAEGSTEITCGGCEQDFFVERNVDVTYTTAPLKSS